MENTYYTVQIEVPNDTFWIINCFVGQKGKLLVRKAKDGKEDSDWEADYENVPIENYGKILNIEQQAGEYHEMWSMNPLK